MALFPSELSPSATMAMARLPARARGEGVSMMQGAEAAFAELGAPSPLGMVLFSGCATDLGIGHADGAWGVAVGAALMGYACGMASSGCRPPHHVIAGLDDEFVFTAAGDVDYAALVEERERLGRLVERGLELAANAEVLIAAAGLSADAWKAFVIVVTHALRRDFVRRGIRADVLPSHETFDELLRIGYALRVLDELAGERPAGRAPTTTPDGWLLWSDDDRAARNRGGAAASASQWIATALAVCAQDYEPVAEQLLQAGVADALGLISPDDLPPGDADAALVAHARFGYALRNTECRSLPASMNASPDDVLFLALDERRGGADLAELLGGIIRYGYCEGVARLLQAIPGAPDTQRAEVFDAWVEERAHGHPYCDAHEVLALLHYGYLLHRAFELQPERIRTAGFLEPEPMATATSRTGGDGRGAG